MLRDPLEPGGLVPDVPHELLNRFRVNMVILKDGITEQTNRGQRGLQLVRGVGHKAPSHFLCCLEPIRQGIELPGQLAQFVPAPHLHPVVILSFPHNADGPQQLSDPVGQRPGKHQRHGQRDRCNDNGNGSQRLLDPHQQLALLRIILVHIYRT